MRKIVNILVLLIIVFSQKTVSANSYVTKDGFQMNIEAIDAQLTSRENPAMVGDTVYLRDIQVTDSSYTEITFTELFDGETAKKLVIAENSWNHEPDEGMQYIVARFNIKFQSENHNDHLFLSDKHFKVVTEKGNVIMRELSNLVFGFNTVGEIYSGAEMILDIPLLIPNTDEKMMLEYWNAWFSIE